MSRDATTEQALALAGVAQFVLYAHEIAAHGHDRPERIEAALHAIFCTDPDSAGDAIDPHGGVAGGVRFLRRQLGRQQPEDSDAEIARNMGQVLRLTGRLMRRPKVLTAIRGAIDRARLADPRQAPVILDEAYRENLSGLGPRVMVRGHSSYLGNAIFEQHIRTHLLAAVRCAVLWRQCGGRFWRLVLMRRRFSESLERLESQPAQR